MDSEWIAIVCVGGGFLVAIVGVVAWAVKEHLSASQREQTKREVAAYVAEGSMTPEDGQRLVGGGSRGDFESKIGNAVSWGMISASKAERLIKAFREDDRPKP